MSHSKFLDSSISSVVSIDLDSSWAARSWLEDCTDPDARARFQQKQMLEKEQKLLRLYENQTQRAVQRVRGSAGSSSSSTSSSSVLGTGKVRQLFEERRGGKAAAAPGWDRSYPLQPLQQPTPAAPKQRVHASKSTGNIKASSSSRGTSLERAHSNSYQPPPRQAAQRSKSQVRPVQATRSFRQLDNDDSYQQEEEEEEDELHNGDLDYDEVVGYGTRNNRLNSFQEEEDRRILLEREHREVEELFSKQSDIFSPSNRQTSSFQRLAAADDADEEDGRILDMSHTFQKLPNVGNKAPRAAVNTTKTTTMSKTSDDKYKTYVANGPRAGAAAKKLAPVAAENTRRHDQPAAHAKAATTHSAPSAKTVRKPEPKIGGSAGKAPLRSNNSSPLVSNQKNSRIDNSQRAPRASQSGISSLAASSSSSSNSSNRNPPKENLATCHICGRNFAPDRLSVHENICSKTAQKKRKTFDPMKQRVKGTEAEQYIKKITSQTAPPKPKKSNWRQKHEEFIQSIRAAKEVKAHLAKGGKLSDLPPPPPSDYSDYVQCPHCSRKFNQGAAERHIPKCANFQFNKPKPNQAAARKSTGAASKTTTGATKKRY